MICCYQITKIFSTRYGSTIASSARRTCNFSSLADLAVSFFREMSINTVFTKILTSLEYGLQRCFVRRTGVRVSVYWNFIIHQIFLNSCSHSGISELARPESAINGSRGSLNNVSPRSFFGSFLFGFGFSLAWLISGRPDRSSTVVDTVTGEMSLSIRSSRSRVLISLTVGEEDEDEEDDEE